ncbi:hypothetical protein HDU76_007338 [Blyttiomyces sp. JEL0837]|nr:hypothetical protein HDU76_007338 [Blyttiomyces sp. JEL0837]
MIRSTLLVVILAFMSMATLASAQSVNQNVSCGPETLTVQTCIENSLSDGTGAVYSDPGSFCAPFQNVPPSQYPYYNCLCLHWGSIQSCYTVCPGSTDLASIRTATSQNCAAAKQLQPNVTTTTSMTSTSFTATDGPTLASVSTVTPTGTASKSGAAGLNVVGAHVLLGNVLVALSAVLVGVALVL